MGRYSPSRSRLRRAASESLASSIVDGYRDKGEMAVEAVDEANDEDEDEDGEESDEDQDGKGAPSTRPRRATGAVIRVSPSVHILAPREPESSSVAQSRGS